MSSDLNLPPNNLDAERRLLGGILRDPDVFETASMVIRVDDFYQHAQQRIYAAISDLVAERKPIDLTLLHDSLRRRRELEDTGGAAGLAELWECEPSGANAEYHAKIIRDAALARRLIHAANEILRDAYGGAQSGEDLLAQAERKILAIAESATALGDTVRSAAEFMQDGLARIDERIAAGAELAGLSTGHDRLDDLIGGFRPDELVILAAPPSVGKTAFALNQADITARNGHAVLVFSLEQPEPEIANRFLAMESGVPMQTFTRGNSLTPEDAENLATAAGSEGIGGRPIYLDDTAGQTAARIAALTRRAVRQKRVELVIVDYLQIMQPENPRSSPHERIGLLALRMKNLAREVHVPIIVLSQITREGAKRDGPPILSDLRDSGDIEAHADRVIFLHRQPNQPTEKETTAIDVIVAKNRNGPIGTTTLFYRKAVLRFEDPPAQW